MAEAVIRLLKTLTTKSTWISKLVKRPTCKHVYKKIDESFGDKILAVDYRSLWECECCGKRKKSWRLDELHLPCGEVVQ